MPRPKDNYFTTKEIVEAASLPIHLLRVQAKRSGKRVSHLLPVGNARFSLPAIPESEVVNSAVGSAAAALTKEAESLAKPSEPAKRWYELVGKQDREGFDFTL
ncbi:MAG: hypothetical protein M0Z84_07930 [Gammaproteobacteria bacterium]|nr:hypothetical protein [Gammaproteobacteria bacterium]